MTIFITSTSAKGWSAETRDESSTRYLISFPGEAAMTREGSRSLARRQVFELIISRTPVGSCSEWTTWLMPSTWTSSPPSPRTRATASTSEPLSRIRNREGPERSTTTSYLTPSITKCSWNRTSERASPDSCGVAPFLIWAKASPDRSLREPSALSAAPQMTVRCQLGFSGRILAAMAASSQPVWIRFATKSGCCSMSHT